MIYTGVIDKNDVLKTVRFNIYILFRRPVTIFDCFNRIYRQYLLPVLRDRDSLRGRLDVAVYT